MAERLQPCGQPASEEKRAASRRRRAERKLTQQRAITGDGAWTRCLYRVPGKQRYCAQHRSKHSTRFCGTHMGETAEKGRRVPCPVDPNHTVFEHQLASHAKICNPTILQARMESQPYYSKGINSGPPLTEEGEMEEESRRAAAVSGSALDEAFLMDLLSRVAAACRDLVGEIPTEVLDDIPEVQALHRARSKDGSGFRKGRHVLQQASLVGHLVKRGLVGTVGGGSGRTRSKCRGGGGGGGIQRRPRMLHVEMGAGKGALGLSIATAFPGSEVTVVERSSVRRKAENRLEGVSARVRIDIRDLNMSGVPSLAPCEEEDGNKEGKERTGCSGGRPVVAVAKHLCGVATDLALRAMLTLEPALTGSNSGGDGGTGASSGDGTCRDDGQRRGDIRDCGDDTAPTAKIPIKTAATMASTRVGGVAIATCCHHVCCWMDYTGRDFLLRQGFTARDFDAMRRMSAWISLEPDPGNRKNNKYPYEKHPTSTAATYNDEAVVSSSPLTSPPLAAIAEVEVYSEGLEPAATSLDAALCPPSASAAGASAVSARTLVPSPEPAAAAAGAAATAAAAPEVFQRHQEGGVGSPRPAGNGTDDVHAHDGEGPAEVGANATATAPTAASGREEGVAKSAGAKPAEATGGMGARGGARGERGTGGGGGARSKPLFPTLNGALPTLLGAEGSPAVTASSTSESDGLPKPLLVLAGLTQAEKAAAARECKRLLDRGRMAFIEERLGLTSEMVHFVEREVTPENALLLGFRA